MKHKLSSLLLATIIFNAGFVFAQSKEESEVAARVEELRNAMISGKKEALAELAADDISYGHSSGKVEDKKTFIDEFVSGRSVFTSISFLDQTVKVTGNAAVVRHRLVGETNNNNVPGKVDIIILLVWQKQKGKWKLLARQAARIPAPAK